MVINCPSCAARYRLGDGRIQGRGARVVCPRCSHVFVILKDPAASSSEVAVEPEPAPEPSATLARTSTGPIRVVTPGPRKQRREVATIEVEAIGSDRSVEACVPAEAPEQELVAGNLDFRDVGIRTWKVRAAIGLTYDFSDLSTLKRYLAQGKVGDDDELSFDRKSWFRLGDIDDLDDFFVAAWKRARAALPADAPPATRQPIAAVPPAPDPRESVRSSARLTPVPERRTRTHRAAPAPKQTNRQLLWVAAAALLVAGWFLAFSHTRPLPVEPPDEVAGQTDGEDDGLDGEPSFDLSMATDPEAEPPEATSEPTPFVVAPPPAPKRLAAPSQWGDTPAPVPVEEKTIAGENWYRGGQRAMEEADYGKARDMFARAVKKDPAEPRYWEALGEAQVVLGDSEGAAVSFSQAQELGQAKVGR